MYSLIFRLTVDINIDISKIAALTKNTLAKIATILIRNVHVNEKSNNGTEW